MPPPSVTSLYFIFSLMLLLGYLFYNYTVNKPVCYSVQLGVLL